MQVVFKKETKKEALDISEYHCQRLGRFMNQHDPSAY